MTASGAIRSRSRRKRGKLLPRFDRIEDTILVTHKGCSDGSGCAITFLEAGGKEENIRYVGAGMVERFVKEDPVFDGGQFLIFADVGVTSPKYADVLEKRGNLVLLDHHKTSLHMLGRPWALIDAEDGGTRCGSRLLAEYLFPGFIPQRLDWLTTVIDDFDRWKRRIPISSELATLSAFIGQERFVRSFSTDLKERWSLVGAELFYDHEVELLKILLAKRDEAVSEAVRKCVVKTVPTPCGLPLTIVYTLSSDSNTSLILDELLKSRPEADLSCQVLLDHNKVSLRSRNDGNIDVAEYASLFGGGGHKHAAGHPLPDGLLLDIIGDIHG